jgi:hypothetical protein
LLDYSLFSKHFWTSLHTNIYMFALCYNCWNNELGPSIPTGNWTCYVYPLYFYWIQSIPSFIFLDSCVCSVFSPRMQKAAYVFSLAWLS